MLNNYYCLEKHIYIIIIIIIITYFFCIFYTSGCRLYYCFSTFVPPNTGRCASDGLMLQWSQRWTSIGSTLAYDTPGGALN